MKKEEIFFLSRDGKTKIHAVKWIPEGKPVCILQIVHGMAEYIERYERLALVLTRQGDSGDRGGSSGTRKERRGKRNLRLFLRA